MRLLAYTPAWHVYCKTSANGTTWNLLGEFVMSKKMRKPRKEPISKALRQTIRERELTAYKMAKKASVSVDAVQRFLNAERGLTLATADKLADALELTLCPDDSTETQQSTV
jgi:hypothetical protein